MLKVNVGMSRKVSKDYNSTGFSVNLDGEVMVSLDDPQGVIAKIHELYDVAEEALATQIERYEGESAIASRDATPTQPASDRRAASPGVHQNGSQPNGNGHTANGNGHAGDGQQVGNGHAANGNAATNKQVQFLLNLAKRQGLTTKQVEARIEEIVGRKAGVYQLTKQEAGQVIDSLNTTTTASGRNGR